MFVFAITPEMTYEDSLKEMFFKTAGIVLPNTMTIRGHHRYCH
jgi:hypothetical protein